MADREPGSGSGSGSSPAPDPDREPGPSPPATAAVVRSRRRAVEARLDRLVRENRFTISVVFPAVGAVLLVASATGRLDAVHPALTFNPTLIMLGTLVMRSPLVVGVLPVLDRRATAGVALLAAYAYLVEFVGVTTGWPYGEFEYVVDLGPTVAGIPLGLPVFFLPLVVNAYLLTLLLLDERAAAARRRVPAVVGVVLCMDLVLDPGAVALGFWRYAAGGPVYGVPLSNYAGWVLSATVTVVVLDAVLDRAALLDRLDRAEFMLDDLVSFVILWGGVNAWFGNWGSVLVALAFGAGLLATERFDSRFLEVRLPHWVRR